MVSTRKRVLDHIDVSGIKASLAISQVELPDADEAFVKSQGQYFIFSSQKIRTPAAAGFCVVFAERQFIYHLQACGLGLAPEFAGTGQATAWEDVLLYEIS
jgi:hypothetical protein